MPRALIVDDSKTAQARLKALLKNYDLKIDIAFSAEEALGYLSYNQPDVIFLDHHMEGMDGLEALRIIKNNPTTAMIPVVMYTSEKGDVYMGQARALGALDILSKEIIKPANIERLLQNLKIAKLGASAQKKEAAPAPAAAAPSDTKAAVNPATSGPTLEEIRSQVARLFELHIADVRQQISENSRFIVRNLRSEINKKAEPASPAAKAPAGFEFTPANELKQPRQPWLLICALVIASLLLIANLVYEFSADKSELDKITEQHELVLNQYRDAQKALIIIGESVAESRNLQQLHKGRFDDLMDAMSWALSIDFSFAFAEQPFNPAQAAKLQELILRLANAGFRGEIALDLHFGDFCLAASDDGSWQLAEAQMQSSSCTMLSSLAVNHAADNYINDVYIELEQTSPPLVNNLIRLSLSSSGVDEQLDDGTMPTAGQWNAKAKPHNRIRVVLIPD
ncbi:response regulator [Agaribacterium haliotis]|uniref:response regulator n=1 Tax=Agaribacterium haliotis TaxID=2013869 RepID=UPI000BB55A2B|nr:response regulator [Agaribacterium haliotis]